MPNDFTTTKDIQIATLMYAQSYLLVNFIIERFGFRGLQDILENLKNKNNIKTALNKVFKEDIHQIERKFVQFLSQEYGLRKAAGS